jgi:hypothetical protein
VYRFTNEEDQQGNKPCPDGFRRWAERFLALGNVMRECEGAIPELGLVKKLRTAAERPAPAAVKYACVLLLLAVEGPADDLAPALEKAHGDPDLLRFVLFLPYIRDALWIPVSDSLGIRCALPPDGTTLEEYQQAQQAFGRRLLESLDDRTSQLPAIDKGAVQQQHALQEQAGREPGRSQQGETRKPKRRRKTARAPAPLTPKQVEAVQLIGEHKGNISAAARAAGKSPQAMTKLYEKASKKLGKKAVEHVTQRLPIDNRGQEAVAAEEEE